MGLFSNQHHQLSYSSVLLIRIHSIDLKNQQKSTLLTRQCSPKKRDNASRVFSLGFVMSGRSFLLIGIEKGQSIFSAALLGKNFFSLILLKFLLLRKCDLRHTQFLKLRQSYQMLLVLTNPFLRLMLQ